MASRSLRPMETDEPAIACNHPSAPPGWGAALALRYERRGLRTVLAARRHEGPLLVQKALYPEGEALCHGIVLHPPGGIVGGDELALEIDAAPQAQVLLTTPGATKLYRSAGAESRQRLRFHVGRDASLEWLPQTTIAFDGTLYRSDCAVALDAGGTYIGWEVLCLGRVARGERFRAGRLAASIEVTSDGAPLWIERAAIEGGSRLLDSPAALDGQPVSGTLIGVGRAIGADVIAACRTIEPAAGRGAVTRLPGLIVARYLGDRAEAAFDYFTRLWGALRPALLGRAAIAPRIWST